MALAALTGRAVLVCKGPMTMGDIACDAAVTIGGERR